MIIHVYQYEDHGFINGKDDEDAYEEDVYNDGKKPDPRSKTRSCNHKIMMHCSPMSLAKTKQV